MRFLVDNALSPRLAALLHDAGHDALHVRDLGLAGATDQAVLDRAWQDVRILVSEDTDFGALLAAGRARHPSVIIFRRMPDRTSLNLARVLIASLSELREFLESGALIIVEPDRARVRMLPIG